MNPEVIPGLENVVWDKIPDDEWDFEYEPLVTPWGSQRSSMVGEPSESHKTFEMLREIKEQRGAYIMTRLTDRAAPIGDTVKLTTIVEGNGVRVNWMKDGEYIERSSHLTVSIIPPMFILQINDVEKKDEGEYTAEIVQGKTKMTTSAKVTVLNIKKEKKVKPFAVRIRDFYHLKYNCLILEAQITGSPRPEVTWYKNDEQVEMNDRTRTDETEGDEIYWLMFHDPVPEDSGLYRCIAENKSGKCAIEHDVVFTKKIPFIHYAGMGHATPKLLNEEQLAEIAAKEQEFKRKAAERVADELAEIDSILRAEELAKIKVRTPTPVPSVKSGEGDEEGEAKEGEEEEEEEKPKPPPKRVEKPKEAPQPYVEESIAVRLSKEKLKWNALLTSRSIPEGGSAKLQCICEGPGSVFKWTKDGKNVEWSDRVKNTSQMGIGEVVITKAQKKDAGVYSCVAKNGRGEIETSCRVTILEPLEKQSIKSPPTFPRGLHENYSILVDELILEVAIRGVPQPEFVWKKDGEPVVADDRIVFHEEKDNVYQLLIHRPVAEDSGKYSVIAWNSEGKKEVSHIVNFVSKSENSRPTVFGIFHKGSVVKPEDSSLEEIIHPPKKEKKEGEEKEEKGPKVQKEMGGGGAKATHFGALHHLKFVSQLRDQYVMEGSTVKLQCYLDGPQPTMKWFKNEKPIQWGQTMINKSRDVHGCCEIQKITMQDSGVYQCVAKNPYNEIETKCRLTVYKNPAKDLDLGNPNLAKPTFTRVMDHYDIVTGDIIIEVQVRGLPQPTLTWVRDGQNVVPSEKYFFMREPDEVYKLCVHNPTLLDAGFYTVKAKNKAGETQIKHKVEFLGRERYEHVPLIAHAQKHLPADETEEGEIVVEEPIKEPTPPPPPAPVAEGEEPAEGEEAPKKRKDPRRWEKMEPSPACKRCRAADVLNFESKLRNVTAPEGTVVKLVCSVSGNNPKFHWFRNGNKLVFDKQVVNKGKLGISSVEIIGATPKHSGTYKVVCENGPCEIESECVVTIFENMEATVPPTFTRLVKEYYDIRSNDLVLEVHCRAVPRPNIKFIKDCLDVSNEEYFPPGKFIIVREAEGIYKLCIHAPERGDSGRYVCEASNKAGKQEITYQLKVKPISEYTYMRGIVTAEPKSKKKYDDEEIVIRSRHASVARDKTPAVPTPAPTPIPPPTPVPTAEGETPAEGVEGEPALDETLTPEELEKARMMAATPPEQKDRDFTDSKYALNFIVQLRDQMTIEGGSARFVCSIDGYRPTLTWYKNNQKISFGDKVKNTSKDTVGSIQLQNLRVADSGIYKCIATNKYGQISTWARLRVIAKGTEETGVAPQFARVRDYYDIPTNQIIVEARILGTAPLEILWYKDCRDIHNGDKYLIGREPGGVYKLYISDPVRRDTGTYMIQVKNAYGYEQVKHEVRFWDKEEYLYVPGINHADPKDKRKHMEVVKLPKKEEEPKEAAQVEHKSRPEIAALEPPTQEIIDERAKEEKQQRKARILKPDPVDFITRLRNQTLAKGSTIHLSCCVSENNRFDAQWFKNDEPLEMDSSRMKTTVNKDSAVATLVIKQAVVDDSGTYKCAIKTKRGPIEGECKVEIFELEEGTPEDVPPTFVIPLHDYYRPKTNDIVIECKIRANPRPRCRWQRDGLFVDHCDKYEPYFMEDGTIMLVVNNPKMIDSGRYLLVVENTVKRVEMWHEVHYEPKYEEKKRPKYDDVIIENEVHPRVYPKPKEPTPPPPVEETPEEAEPEEPAEEEGWGVPDSEEEEGEQSEKEEE